MKGVRIEDLAAAAKGKPPGYTEDVLSYVVERNDTHLIFEDDDYYALRQKYSGDVDPSLRGVGTELHKLLACFGIHMAKGCSCRARMVQMNKWGVPGCEENIETITAWLKEEASRRGLPYLSTVGKMLVRRAIHNARKEAQRAEATT
ncbi:MAG: hypothetical protein ACO3IT_09280 [Ilumatobacteraceae bacterium]